MLHAIISSSFELIAAFSGFYFLRKNRNSKLRLFVYFLVITVFVDALGSYTSFIDKIEILKVLKTTPFRTNSWLFNIYLIFSSLFYLYFYKTLLSKKKHKKIITLLLFITIFIIPLNIYIDRSTFFDALIKYNFIWTTFLVFICVSLYFYELLLSDNVLNFYKSTLFYISIGILLWWLIMPPMMFYMPYYKEIYPNVVNIRFTLIICANIYMYGCFIIGFLWGKE